MLQKTGNEEVKSKVIKTKNKDAPFSTFFRSKCNVPLGALFKHLFRILFLFDNATTEA
jgi:hypothetical protein